MFAHLKGTIEKNESDHLVIDVNGVGYFVFASRLTLSNIAIGDSVKLHIETLMRQEALQLFGFLSEEEISWFRLLLTVQGVGPKVALGIIGSLGLRDLSQAILHQDKAMVSRADGVGPKLAGRILLELKDKLKSMDFSEQNEGIMGVTSMTPAHTVGHFAVDDAISALINLGYSRLEAQKALSFLDNVESKDSATLIRLALQQMQQHRRVI